MGLDLPAVDVPQAYRDTVEPLAVADEPKIVSISDIHGYLAEARSALLTLSDHPAYEPVVTTAADGTLQWAHNDYVLIFNGDLVDRGPDNDAVLKMVGRLATQAPSGRVRVTLGNHEGMILTPDTFRFDYWYSTNVSESLRRSYLEWIIDGLVVAAYEGYSVTYAHAGADDPYNVSEVNEAVLAAADRLQTAVGTPDDRSVQAAVIAETSTVLGTGEVHLKRPPAGLIWLDFQFISADAPRQVVGHTRHDRPTVKGNVYCQNVIRNTRDSSGGECVFVESPGELIALVRGPEGGVSEKQLTEHTC